MEKIINFAIPHVGEQIFENIATKKLVRFLSVSQTWRDLAKTVLLKRWKGKLFKACEDRETEIVKLLLQHSQIGESELNAKYDRGLTGLTAFLVACYYHGYNDIVELLLNHQRNDGREMLFRQKDKNGNTALILACSSGCIDTVELLLNQQRNGIDLNSRSDDGMNALMLACTLGYKDVVQLLLEHPNSNIDIDAKERHGCTAFMLACSSGNGDVVEYLLRESDKNIDLNDQDIFGKTALMLSCSYGRTNVVEILLSLSYRIDLNVRDDVGWTAFTVACVYGHKRIVQMLLCYPGVADLTIAENAQVSEDMQEFVINLTYLNQLASNASTQEEIFFSVLSEKLLNVIAQQEAE